MNHIASKCLSKSVPLQMTTCCPLYLVWLATVAMVPRAAGSDPNAFPPLFAEATRRSQFLGSNESWIPGTTTLISALKVGQSVVMVADSEAVFDGVTAVESMQLLYKCSSKDPAYLQIPIYVSNGYVEGGTSSRYCSSQREFSFTKQSRATYILTILSNNVSYHEAFSFSLELRLRATVSGKALESCSLFVFNIESAMARRLNATVNNVSYERYILSEDAMRLLLGPYRPDSNTLASVKFLDNEFVDLVNGASALMRSLVSVSLHVQRNTSTSKQANCHSEDRSEQSILFNSALRYLKSKNSTDNNYWYHPLGVINVHTGVLLYLNLLQSKIGLGLHHQRVCLTLSLNTDTWSHYILMELAYMTGDHSGQIRKSDAKLLPTEKHYEDECLTNSVGLKDESAELTVFAGLSNALIVSPLVCSRGRLFMQFRGTHCVTTEEELFEGASGRPHCGHLMQDTFYDDAPTLSVIINNEIDIVRHTGILVFKSDTAALKIALRVVSMPLFNSATESLSLPPVTYANLDYRVSLPCMAIHSGVSVGFQAMARQLRAGSWDDSLIDNFVMEILHRAPRTLEREKFYSDPTSSLNLTLPHVDSLWKPLSVAFICRCTVWNSASVNLIGVPEYYAESYTRIKYRGDRPARSGVGGVGGNWKLLAAVIVAGGRCIIESLLTEFLHYL